MEDCEIIELYWERNDEAISESAMKQGSFCSRAVESRSAFY